ncbi:MAG: aspartate/glutamate racemase family protein [Candidatus Thorarchaeota archaeon]
MKRIALIGATGIDWYQNPKKEEFVRAVTPSGFEIHNFTPRHGTHSVESNVDEAYNAPFILEQVMRANTEGFDAIVLDCAGDPIIEAAREISTVPVVGPRKSSLHLALTLGTRFSIITVQGSSLVRYMNGGVRKEGLEPFCVSVRYLAMPVLDISKRPSDAQRELLEVARLAVSEDKADVIVLGCTGLSHEVDLGPIMEELGVPILDPFVVAVRTAALLVESGLSHSKVAYPFPPKKAINEAPSLKGAFDEVLKD